MSQTQSHQANPSRSTGPRYARDPGMPLSTAALLFVKETPARMLLSSLLGLVIIRIAVGAFSLWDLAALLMVVVLQPFAEWLIHVFILHSRPTTILGFHVDMHAARHHRLHHRDPWDLRYTVMPLPIMFVASALISVSMWLIMPTFGSLLSALIFTTLAALAYEWVHFLIHTSYRPRTRWFTHLWRMHRLHHFKNEKYWMGVSRTFGDRVLGTMPDPNTVPASPTAKTLGMDEHGRDQAHVDE